MSRRIVFAGSTQTRALARVYRAEVATQTGDDVIFVGTGTAGTPDARSTLLMADIVAMEIDEDGDALPHGDLPSHARIVRIPNLYCDFLWPFAGRANPRNSGAFALPGGPYPAEHGDRFLDGMVADGVYETTAITRYKAMDIAKEGELDSRLAERSAILARLDAASGFDLAPFIIERFRTEQLFRTRQRLTLPLVSRLVHQLFAKLGVQGWRADSLRRVPFPAGAQPIHPGVIAHFGLTWARPNGCYPVNEEGFFTFEAFCRRYMGFVWNEALHRGLQTAKIDLAAALPDLEQGVAESPESPLGKLALAAARQANAPEDEAIDPVPIIDVESYDPKEEAAAALPPILPDLGWSNPDAPSVARPSLPRPSLPRPSLPRPSLPKPGPAKSDTAGPDLDRHDPDWPKLDLLNLPDLDAPGLALPSLGAAAANGGAVLAAQPEADLLGDAAPARLISAEGDSTPAHAPAPQQDAPMAYAAEEDLIGEAAPPVPVAKAPPRAAGWREETAPPQHAATAEDFADFWPGERAGGAAASQRSDLIGALPGLLPVFAELTSNADRPFGTMPEIMPPPPMRPILPPELQPAGPRPGLLARMLGKK